MRMGVGWSLSSTRKRSHEPSETIHAYASLLNPRGHCHSHRRRQQRWPWSQWPAGSELWVVPVGSLRHCGALALLPPPTPHPPLPLRVTPCPVSSDALGAELRVLYAAPLVCLFVCLFVTPLGARGACVRPNSLSVSPREIAFARGWEGWGGGGLSGFELARHCVWDMGACDVA